MSILAENNAFKAQYIYNYEKEIVTIYIFCGLFFNLNANVVTLEIGFDENKWCGFVSI